MNWPCAVPFRCSSTSGSLPRFWPFCVVLLLGVPTAITEVARAVAEDAWKPDHSRRPVPGLGAEYSPHYATRLTGSPVKWLLRPVGNFNVVIESSGSQQPGPEDAG